MGQIKKCYFPSSRHEIVSQARSDSTLTRLDAFTTKHEEHNHVKSTNGGKNNKTKLVSFVRQKTKCNKVHCCFTLHRLEAPQGNLLIPKRSNIIKLIFLFSSVEIFKSTSSHPNWIDVRRLSAWTWRHLTCCDYYLSLKSDQKRLSDRFLQELQVLLAQGCYTLSHKRAFNFSFFLICLHIHARVRTNIFTPRRAELEPKFTIAISEISVDVK